jgi:hypothetical protein
MSDDNSTSLVNLGSLSKPADTLIKKVSLAIGGVLEPWQLKRVAKAEVEVNLIKAKSEIEITDLHRRAMHRFVEEEANRQENMEEITKKSLSYLDGASDPSKMDDDWITNFFDKSRIVSDNKMQDIWARVLAGEANSPGTYSKRTVNFLGDMDKRDAELFRALCGFGWIIGNFTPLIFDEQDAIYGNKGINFDSLNHLNSIGLIQFNTITGFELQKIPESFVTVYCGQSLVLTMANESDNKLTIGKVMLTRIGVELTHVCQAPGVDGFYDYVKEKWRAYIPEMEAPSNAFV